MNPAKDFQITNFKNVLREIEELGRIECLREVEEKIIQEIISLIEEDSAAARAELLKIETIINEELGFEPRHKLLFSALKNSISGALSVAKSCLL
ncbi:MAG: hypothetical protein ABIH69_02875 [bacterium]|nr:hypothetical protein [Candidatus Margulisiibacteriota bacterium]